jgi:hypothetical protein
MQQNQGFVCLGARERARGAFGDLHHTIYHELSLPPIEPVCAGGLVRNGQKEANP